MRKRSLWASTTSLSGTLQMLGAFLPTWGLCEPAITKPNVGPEQTHSAKTSKDVQDADQRLQAAIRLRVAVLQAQHTIKPIHEGLTLLHSVSEGARRDGSGREHGAADARISGQLNLAAEQQNDAPSGGSPDERDTEAEAKPPDEGQHNVGLWQRDTLLDDAGGIRPRLQKSGIQVEIRDINEAIGNLVGGIRRGARYDGSTSFDITVDLGQAIGWTGATFFSSVKWFRGRSATRDLVGSLQQVSYNEVGRSGLRDIWLEQALLGGALSVRGGQERVDQEFLGSRYGEVLINSTFAWPGLANANLAFGDPTSLLSTPFVRVAVAPREDLRLLGAVFKGMTSELHGTFAIGEAQYKPDRTFGLNLPGLYKAGFFVQGGNFEDQFFSEWSHHNAFGFYLGIDQMVWRRLDTEDEGIGAFARVVFGDRHSLFDMYVDGGLSWKGPFASRPDDVSALGVAYLRASKEARNQAAALFAAEDVVRPLPSYQIVLEATYLAQVTGWLQVQSDLQYIVRPDAGIPVRQEPGPLKNALVIGLRFTLTY